MINKKHRSDRMEGELQKVLAEIVREDLKDPRLELITFTKVKVARDLSFAKVYVSHLDEAKLKEGISVLNKAKGLIRKEIGMKMKLRIVPEVAFVIDDSLSYSKKIDDLLNEIKKEDK